MEEFPIVRKPYGSKLISIRIYEDMTEHHISVERAELLCERLRIVLEHEGRMILRSLKNGEYVVSRISPTPILAYALGKPPLFAVTDFGDCSGMDCSMCRHDIHCDDDCVHFRKSRAADAVAGDRQCIIYKYDDECSYIGAMTCNIIPWYSRIEDARKFASERDAVAYAREIGILDDVSFRFVRGDGEEIGVVRGDGEIGVGDLVSRGGSDRWVVTISYPALRAVRVLCVCAGSDWLVSDQGAISVDDASLIAKAGKWGS